MVFEMVSASVVLPTPGISSNKICPPAIIAAKTFSVMLSFPFMTRLISLIILLIFSCISFSFFHMPDRALFMVIFYYKTGGL